jgi:hypothetical protein
MNKTGMKFVAMGLCTFIAASMLAGEKHPGLYFDMLVSALVMAIGAVMLILSWFAIP